MVVRLQVGDIGVYQKDKSRKVSCMENHIGHKFIVEFIDDDGYVGRWIGLDDQSQYYIRNEEVNQGRRMDIPWL